MEEPKCRSCGKDYNGTWPFALPDLCMYCWDGNTRGTTGWNWLSKKEAKDDLIVVQAVK